MATRPVKKSSAAKKTAGKAPAGKKEQINFSLADEQKKVHEDFYNYDVLFVLGKAGSGKTQVATAIGMKNLLDGPYEKMVITRPIVKDGLGHLPGTMEDKMRPWIAPIKYCLERVCSKIKVEEMMTSGQIEILPIDYAKGITYVNSIVIIDEFQDMNYEDFELMLSRLGKDSKIFFTGSKEQIHKTMKKDSCIHKVKHIEGAEFVSFTELKMNHRNEVIFKIFDYLDKKNGDRTDN